MVSYGVAVSSLAVKFLFRQLMYSLRISVRVISVGPLSTLRHVALKETYPQPWSDIMVKETREVNGRTFYFFQDINTRRGDLCRILLALSLSHLTESVPELPEIKLKK